RRFAFALPRIRTPEDAEAAIDVVTDGLAEGVLSLADAAELLRIVERLLEMAEKIQEMKRMRDLLARRPSAEPDQEAVQEALAAARQLNPRQGVEADDAGADALYFPVNRQAQGDTEAVERPPGSRSVTDSPPPAERTPEPVAA